MGGQHSNPAKRKNADFHGGLSTRPKTAECKQRIADAQTVHGWDTKAAMSERSRGSLRLAQLEGAMHVLEMTSAKRTRRRKPNGYALRQTIDDFCRFLLDSELHPVRGVADGR